MAKLALFFTEGVSLRVWHQAGLAQRDSLLYEHLCAAGHEVYFITYGFEDDTNYLPPGSPIKVLTRPRHMGQREYSWKIHAVHREVLQTVDVIKSHQMAGARFAAYAKFRLRKADFAIYPKLNLGYIPYIARCGYLPSYFLAQEKAPFRQRLRNWIEEFVSFHAANVICVPSEAEIRYLRKRYGINPAKAHACPNWVDADFFRPDEAVEKHPRRICSVGRFHDQKDPLVLIEALRGMENVELVMIGGGPLKDTIEARINAYGIMAQVLERVPNEDLPRHLNASAIYVLPTRYEGGSPKTLFEAMACGLPVVSTDGFGVNEVFEDGQHGYKVPVGDVLATRQAIQRLLDNPARARQFGQQGRQHVIANYSVSRAVERELAILDALTNTAS